MKAQTVSKLEDSEEIFSDVLDVLRMFLTQFWRVSSRYPQRTAGKVERRRFLTVDTQINARLDAKRGLQ